MNELLLFLSARGSGTWRRFRGAIEELQPIKKTSDNELPPEHRTRHVLEQLAHVEFFTTGGDWRVTPPVLAHNGSSGILCGARSTQLLASIGSIATIERQPDGPDTITINGTIEELETIGSELKVHVQADAARAILHAIPGIDDPQAWVPTTLPAGQAWDVQRFTPSDLQWKPSSLEQAMEDDGGLYRFRTGHERRYVFCTNRQSFVTTAQTGKYLALYGTSRTVLEYDATQHSLIVPTTMRPPLLVERALVLCTGRLPNYLADRNALKYTNISYDVATITRLVLGQS